MKVKTYVSQLLRYSYLSLSGYLDGTQIINETGSKFTVGGAFNEIAYGLRSFFIIISVFAMPVKTNYQNSQLPYPMKPV